MYLVIRSHCLSESSIDGSTPRYRNSFGILPLPIGIPPIVTIESHAPHLHDFNDHNTRQMTIINYNYQSATESHKRLQELAIGDEVLIRVHPKRFPLRTLKKLHTRRRGPYKFLRRFASVPTSSI